jgi:predicted nucleic acid-binding protein
MTELLVLPYRDANQQQVDYIYALLSTYPNLEWVQTSLQIADIAARIRGVHGLRTPDALQAATAVCLQATALITNDPVFDRVKEFESLVLDRMLP